MDKIFRNVIYLADRSGTSKWRRTWATSLVECYSQNINTQVDYSQTPILDPRYYNGVNSITIQRWVNDQHREIVEKLLKPISEQHKSWLIYEIDDLMDARFIPHFNRGKNAFESPQIQENIKQILNMCDMITVTTDYIKEAYHKYYNIPLHKIVALPNMLPRYLFGDRYDIQKKINQFKTNKAKPRIGIVSSLSHYNIQNVMIDNEGNTCRQTTEIDPTTNEQKEIWKNQNDEIVDVNNLKPIYDDLDIIIDCIRSTVNDFQWVIFGYEPPKLKDLIEKGKIEVHSGTAIMNYPSKFENLNLQAVVAPIQDIEFNRCKSFIKYMECASLGVPLFASDALPYNRVMSDRQLFKTGDELKEKLIKLKFSSVGSYSETIEKQWRWLNTPCHEGDFDIKNFWMEDNLNIWIDLTRLRDKSALCSLSAYIKSKKEQEREVIYSNENGVEIK